MLNMIDNAIYYSNYIKGNNFSENNNGAIEFTVKDSGIGVN